MKRSKQKSHKLSRKRANNEQTVAGTSRRNIRKAKRKQNKMKKALNYAKAKHTNKVCINSNDMNTLKLLSNDSDLVSTLKRKTLTNENNISNESNIQAKPRKKKKKRNPCIGPRSGKLSTHYDEATSSSFQLSDNANLRLAKLQEYINQEVEMSKRLDKDRIDTMITPKSKKEPIKDKGRLKELRLGQINDEEEIDTYTKQLPFCLSDKEEISALNEDFGDILNDIKEGTYSSVKKYEFEGTNSDSDEKFESDLLIALGKKGFQDTKRKSGNNGRVNARNDRNPGNKNIAKENSKMNNIQKENEDKTLIFEEEESGIQEESEDEALTFEEEEYGIQESEDEALTSEEEENVIQEEYEDEALISEEEENGIQEESEDEALTFEEEENGIQEECEDEALVSEEEENGIQEESEDEALTFEEEENGIQEECEDEALVSEEEENGIQEESEDEVHTFEEEENGIQEECEDGSLVSEEEENGIQEESEDEALVSEEEETGIQEESEDEALVSEEEENGIQEESEDEALTFEEEENGIQEECEDEALVSEEEENGIQEESEDEVHTFEEEENGIQEECEDGSLVSEEEENGIQEESEDEALVSEEEETGIQEESEDEVHTFEEEENGIQEECEDGSLVSEEEENGIQEESEDEALVSEEEETGIQEESEDETLTFEEEENGIQEVCEDGALVSEEEENGIQEESEDEALTFEEEENGIQEESEDEALIFEEEENDIQESEDEALTSKEEENGIQEVCEDGALVSEEEENGIQEESEDEVLVSEEEENGIQEESEDEALIFEEEENGIQESEDEALASKEEENGIQEECEDEALISEEENGIQEESEDEALTFEEEENGIQEESEDEALVSEEEENDIQEESEDDTLISDEEENGIQEEGEAALISEEGKIDIQEESEDEALVSEEEENGIQEEREDEALTFEEEENGIQESEDEALTSEEEENGMQEESEDEALISEEESGFQEKREDEALIPEEEIQDESEDEALISEEEINGIKEKPNAKSPERKAVNDRAESEYKGEGNDIGKERGDESHISEEEVTVIEEESDVESPELETINGIIDRDFSHYEGEVNGVGESEDELLEDEEHNSDENFLDDEAEDNECNEGNSDDMLECGTTPTAILSSNKVSSQRIIHPTMINFRVYSSNSKEEESDTDLDGFIVDDDFIEYEHDDSKADSWQLQDKSKEEINGIKEKPNAKSPERKAVNDRAESEYKGEGNDIGKEREDELLEDEERNSDENFLDDEAEEDNECNEGNNDEVFEDSDDIFECGTTLTAILSSKKVSSQRIIHPTMNGLISLYSSNSEEENSDTDLDGFIVDDDFVEYEQDDSEVDSCMIRKVRKNQSRIVGREQLKIPDSDIMQQLNKAADSSPSVQQKRRRILSDSSDCEEINLLGVTNKRLKVVESKEVQHFSNTSSNTLPSIQENKGVSRAKKQKKKKKKRQSSYHDEKADIAEVCNGLCVKRNVENKENLVIDAASSLGSREQKKKRKSKKKIKACLAEEFFETKGCHSSDIPVISKSDLKKGSYDQIDGTDTLSQATIHNIKSRAKPPKNVTFVLSEKEEEVDSSTKKKDYYEDIYGRLRDKAGNVITVEEDSNIFSGNKYVPPAMRKLIALNNSEKKKEQLATLRRNLKGLLNRLAESNMAAIVSQIEGYYHINSRNDMNDSLTKLLLEMLVTPVLTPEKLVQEHALMIAILSANVGPEVGAHVLTEFVVKWVEELEAFRLVASESEVHSKSLDNLLLFIGQLYHFRVVDATLMYDILHKIVERPLQAKEIDLILLILRTIGFTLRKDDPLELKRFITNVQSKADDVVRTDLNQNYTRGRFMLEILTAIRNNNVSKVPNYDPTHSQHLKTIMKGFIRKGSHTSDLKVSLQDLLKSKVAGKWWVVGSAWCGGMKEEMDSLQESSAKNEDVSSASFISYSEEFKKKAAKLHMSRPPRINILYATTVGAENYMDAFDNLVQLKLKPNQEGEIFNVLVYCCIRCKEFNIFCVSLALKLCSFKKGFARLLKFSIWDRFKELQSMKPQWVSNLAKFVAYMVGEGGLDLSIFKVLNFVEADNKTISFLRQSLIAILLHPTGTYAVSRAFSNLCSLPKWKVLTQYLRLFIVKFINPKRFQGKEMKVLENRIKDVLDILNSVGGVKL